MKLELSLIVEIADEVLKREGTTPAEFAKAFNQMAEELKNDPAAPPEARISARVRVIKELPPVIPVRKGKWNVTRTGGYDPKN